MRIKGKKVEGPKPKYVAIPRETTQEDGSVKTEDFVFQCDAVLDWTEFEQLCPEPKPPVEFRPGEGNVVDIEDKEYLAKLEKHGEMRRAWLIITSLRGTEGLEWETVRYNDPNTWMNYEDELLDSFTQREYQLILMGVFDANAPSEERQKEALSRFFNQRRAALVATTV